jgi:hypothetical protein
MADNQPIVSKSGSLDLQEPCGPAQACNGTALTLPEAKTGFQECIVLHIHS